MKRMTFLFLALVLLLSGCGAAEPAVTPGAEAFLEFTDDLGRTVSVAEKPERVAALIGSFADIWCLAGGKDALVAAADDSWTSFDLGLSDAVANLGAVKEPSLETLLAAEPDLVLASCNTAADLELEGALTAAGVCTAYFDVQSLDDYLNMLDICTRLTGCDENYETYGAAVREQADAAIARQDGSAPTVVCMRATGVSVKIKGSEGFVLGEMLRDLGCVNLASAARSRSRRSVSST